MLPRFFYLRRLLDSSFFVALLSPPRLFLLLPPVHARVGTHARLLRDLHRRMCWDNLVVIVLSLFTGPPPASPRAAGLLRGVARFLLSVGGRVSLRHRRVYEIFFFESGLLCVRRFDHVDTGHGRFRFYYWI